MTDAERELLFYIARKLSDNASPGLQRELHFMIGNALSSRIAKETSS